MIQRFKKIILALFICSLLLEFSSCKTEAPENDEFAIHFAIANANQRKIYISELTSEGEVLLDSIVLKKDGSACFIHKVENRTMYLIKTEGNLRNFLTLLPDSTEIIKLTADYDSLIETYNLWVCRELKGLTASNIVLDETSVQAMKNTSSKSMECTGFTASDLILPLQKKVRQNLILIDSLSRLWQTHIYASNADSLRKVLDSAYLLAMREQKQMQMQLASENPTTLVPIYAIYQLFGDQMLFDFNDPADLDTMTIWINQMLQTQRGNPHVDKLKMRVDRLKVQRKNVQMETETQNPS